MSAFLEWRSVGRTYAGNVARSDRGNVARSDRGNVARSDRGNGAGSQRGNGAGSQRGNGAGSQRVAALHDFSLEAAEGTVLGLLGPSGSGKSTLLRLTAGLEEPSAGKILLEGRDLAGAPAHARRFGLMFQEYCLFPHLDVRRNVEFGLRMLRAEKSARGRRVDEMLRLVRLEGLGHRDVNTLSGGEQQRVALARSLAPSPRLLMLDEPLGALDAALRQSLLGELAQILAQVGVTTLYVTHDQAEAMTIASRVALMRDGTLVQVGTPTELMTNPVNAFAASFLGLGTLVPGSWEGADATEYRGRATFVTPLGRFARTELGAAKSAVSHGGPAMLLIPPSALLRQPSNGLNVLHCRIESRIPRPSGTVLRISIQGNDGEGATAASYPAELLLAAGRSDPADSWRTGDERLLWLDAGRCSVLPA